MDQTIKEEWLAALRSGQYKQGKEQLQTPYSEFCCLGVLCDIMSKRNPTKYVWNDRGKLQVVKNGKVVDSNDTVLPINLHIEVGLNNFSPAVLYKGQKEALAYLNDDLGLSFFEIADLIEEQF